MPAGGDYHHPEQRDRPLHSSSEALVRLISQFSGWCRLLSNQQLRLTELKCKSAQLALHCSFYLTCHSWHTGTPACSCYDLQDVALFVTISKHEIVNPEYSRIVTFPRGIKEGLFKLSAIHFHNQPRERESGIKLSQSRFPPNVP